MTSERSKNLKGATSNLSCQPGQTSRGLEEANAAFRDAYAVARDRVAGEVPIFIVMADDLILRHGRRRVALRFTPATFHPLKGAAHVLVALLSLLVVTPEGKLEGDSARRLEAVQRAIGTIRARPVEGGDLVMRAVTLAHDLATDIARASRVDQSRLEQGAREALPILVELTEKAANVRLVALHARVQELLAELSPTDRQLLHVVVAGDHQARRRSLGMQYFERRFTPRQGEAERVIYGESVASEDDAVTLVGACRVDREIARAVFGDPSKLQEDILGDATKKELEGLNLTPIE